MTEFYCNFAFFAIGIVIYGNNSKNRSMLHQLTQDLLQLDMYKLQHVEFCLFA